MDARQSRFNLLMLVLMILLYLLSLGSFTYLNWTVEPEHIIWNHLLNALILSIPLVLLYGGLYVLITAWRQYQQSGQIDLKSQKLIHWAPRIAAILIIFFVSLFSLDVFDMEATPLEMLGGFLMHNIPSFIMIVLLIFAWQRPVVGFIAFLLAGVFFLRFVMMGPDLGNFILFSGPLLLISALFYADWRWVKKGLAPLP
jgi:hypothetical protein